jgi:cytochrome c biogenesis protein CcmG/thiol:disulfide interchange protein DsbE
MKIESRNKPRGLTVFWVMRPTLLLTAFSLFLSGNIAADEVRIAPDWTLQSQSGASITLSEVAAEQPVIVLFWATWCPYCKALMPHIQSIRLERGDEIRVLAVHFRDDKGDPVAFIEDAGYDFTLLPDGGEVAKLNEVWGTPGLMIVDRDRVIRFDLYALPKLDLSAAGKSPAHSKKAAYLAPYWAAEIRKSLDLVLSERAK